MQVRRSAVFSVAESRFRRTTMIPRLVSETSGHCVQLLEDACESEAFPSWEQALSVVMELLFAVVEGSAASHPALADTVSLPCLRVICRSENTHML